MFFGRNDAKAETLVLWPPHVKHWLIGKDSDAGRDWGQEEKGTTEDEMAGWHHRLDGHEFEWTPGVGDGQGGLASCDSWCHKKSDMTEQLNWAELKRQNEKSFWKVLVNVIGRGFRFKMAEQKDMRSSPPARAPKSQLAVEQPSTGTYWNPPKKI